MAYKFNYIETRRSAGREGNGWLRGAARHIYRLRGLDRRGLIGSLFLYVSFSFFSLLEGRCYGPFKLATVPGIRMQILKKRVWTGFETGSCVILLLQS